MIKLIFASVLTATISVSASYGASDVTTKADGENSTHDKEAIALKPENIDTKKVDPDSTFVVKTSTYKGLKDLPYVADIPVSVF